MLEIYLEVFLIRYSCKEWLSIIQCNRKINSQREYAQCIISASLLQMRWVEILVPSLWLATSSYAESKCIRAFWSRVSRVIWPNLTRQTIT